MVTDPGNTRPKALSIAMSRPVVRRAVGYGVVVGTVLIAINHGDAIVAGDVGPGRLLKMLLTTLVPYTVSTLSSVGAMREMESRPAEEEG